jgi:hypothetical protein
MKTYAALAAMTLAPAGMLAGGEYLSAQYPYSRPAYPSYAQQPPAYGQVSPAGTVSVLRMFNPATGDHLWTTDPNEVNTLLYQGSWHVEGEGFRLNAAPGEGLVPLYRVYWPNGDHSVATVPPQNLPPGAQAEGVLGYASTEQLPGLVPLFGFRNRYGREFFTTDPNGETVTRRAQRFVVGFVQPGR